MRDPVVKIFLPAPVASLFAAGFLDFARNDRRRVAALLVAVGIFASALVAGAAENIPPKPAGYFTDYAGVVSKEAALRFNEKLAQFERDTSNQVVVAVFRKMESDSSIADYTYRVAEAWGVGQKDRRNGAVLFVFVENRNMFLQVGYGLEGALPDATAFDITERRIKPRFRNNDYEGGIATGIDSIFAAIRGEYKGTGRTKAEEKPTASGNGTGFIILLICVVIFALAIGRGRRRRGYGYSSLGGPFIGGWSGGGWSGGSSSGGGFSGFSGGGGSFGGGGAGSSW